MTGLTGCSIVLGCLFMASMFVCVAQHGVNAAAIPQTASTSMTRSQGYSLPEPTPLPVVMTYTLYFGLDGATVSSPVQTRTAPTVTDTTTPASAASANVSSTGRCSKKQVSDRVARGMRKSTSPSVNDKKPASLIRKSQAHTFANKVDSLVQSFNGITGRKARQLALIFNRTDANVSTSKSNILSHLQQAYPSSSTNSSSSVPNTDIIPYTNNLTSSPHSLTVKPGRSDIVLFSNTPNYGPLEVRHDLHVIRAWADDLDQLSTRPLLDETVAAVLSSAARYYPELSTRDAARVIMADIKAESDFDPWEVSGGRLDSGTSLGLMQVSPFGSGELTLFQQHANVWNNTLSWESRDKTRSSAGPLLDWATGKVLDLHSLTVDDLFRPWINIHVASWIQSNLARTSSQDPYSWPAIYAQSVNASNISSYKLAQALKGAGLPRSFLTGLGSWVAGPAVDGYGSYDQPGDDVSNPYFNNIVEGLSVLYGYEMDVSWLNGLRLHAGLVDYH